MTVRELMRALIELPPTKTVYVRTNSGGLSEVQDVSCWDFVVIETPAEKEVVERMEKFRGIAID